MHNSNFRWQPTLAFWRIQLGPPTRASAFSRNDRPRLDTSSRRVLIFHWHQAGTWNLPGDGS